jgi:chromosome segregation and condensation protein ScpB
MGFLSGFLQALGLKKHDVALTTSERMRSKLISEKKDIVGDGYIMADITLYELLQQWKPGHSKSIYELIAESSEKPLSQAEIQERLGIKTKSEVSTIIKVLDSLGLVAHVGDKPKLYADAVKMPDYVPKKKKVMPSV